MLTNVRPVRGDTDIIPYLFLIVNNKYTESHKTIRKNTKKPLAGRVDKGLGKPRLAQPLAGKDGGSAVKPLWRYSPGGWATKVALTPPGAPPPRA